ncbi:MAG: Fe-S oxidoreductase [Solidesulfovibrio magneticus str. Maddingley MBC34]|uniref:Glycolate oxidase iron-sulfur subunit n=1 Tax=Solidesulfovibrio magneticus str. Maddingley MBC34 TaxID=1206767 RepID=K6HAS3_9BACT|nr:MAG: Fe-S oxidoreductase [Solidesulfovibrio magneticus str. Maddingley MBC34]
MSEMRQLVGLLKQIDDQLVACMRCGMCQAVCPIYAETGLEGHVARGKIALLECLADEVIKDPAGVKERLDACLLCGSCQANCPSGVKALDIFLKARAFLTGYYGLPPVKRAIFRGLLQNPKLFDTVLGVASKFQGLFTKPVNDMLGSSCARVFSDLIGGRHFAPLADKPLHDVSPARDTPRGHSGLKIAFFYGCVVDKMFPRIGEAVLKVCDHHGVGVFMPHGQACCGIPALSSGDRETFEKLVALNMKVFAEADFDVLVTPCATCTSTIKKIWPLMAEDLPATTRFQIKELSAKVKDISAFLIQDVGVTPADVAVSGEPATVTYHDPCHLKKSLGISAEPRALIGCNPRYKLKEMEGADSCCGSGGSFTLQHYDLSKRIGKRKRDNIVATGATVAATSCPACMLQIGDMLSQAGDKLAIRHPVEIYAETLAGR